MQRLGRPAAFDEGCRQPIEQFRVCWLLAKHAEIIRRSHQPFTKVMLPHTIYKNSCRQRIDRIDHCLSQLFTPATLIKMLAVFARHNAQKPARRHLAWLQRIAA